MSEDEFDNVPDDFADIQDIDWTRILAGPDSNRYHSDLSSTEEPIFARPSSSNSSTDYFENDNLNPSILAELDRIEERLAEAPQHPRFMGGAAVLPSQSQTIPSSQLGSHCILTHNKRKDVAANSQSDEEIPSALFKKRRLEDASYLTSPRDKGKMKANDDILQRILSAFEDEIICPICCDFYVFAHISNPCGHSFCGSCGREWHMKNKSCPVCRTCLEETSPMIPNIAIDNVVEKHIRALALSGDQDWELGGFKAEEWHKRKQTWRDGAREREKIKPSAVHQTRTFIPSVIDLTDAIHTFNQPSNWSRTEDRPETDPIYEDTSDIELIPRPIRRARRRRQQRVAAPTAMDIR